MIENSRFSYIKLPNNAAAALINKSSKDLFEKPNVDPKEIKDAKGKKHLCIYWGSDNKLPQEIITKVAVLPELTSGMYFNMSMGYGQGIMPVRITPDTTNSGEIKMSYTPVLDNTEINEFLQRNNIAKYLQESLMDLYYFYHNFCTLHLNKESSGTRKIVELRHREAAFTRFTKMNDEGIIENCLYSALWGDNSQEDKDVSSIPLLDMHNPVMDLERKMGRIVRPDAKTKDDLLYEYMVSVDLPSPGRAYYRKPPWYALIESGWYDFATAIPEFKKAILKNQMTIKYIVYIEEEYFKRIFAEESVTDDKAKKERVTLEYKNIQDFLSGSKNAGKTLITRMRYDKIKEGLEKKDITIQTVDNHFKGGEYIEDNEEVSSIVNFAQGIHGSVIGSFGKAKNINGTEARELFMIKQALQKPIRDRLLLPFYIVKKINKWPEDIHFIIPNLELTTIDSNTGSKKSIGNQAT